MRVEDDRILFYSEALDDLTEKQLTHGFDIAKRNLGTFLPDVKQLRDWAESWRPAGYEQQFEQLDKSALTKNAVRLKITKAEIAEWLEGGKEAQQEHIAKLEADPEWQAMYQRLVSRDFVKPSTVPADPEERKAWATAKAEPWRRA